MSTLFYTHPACLEHDTGPGHPERPERLTAILNMMDTPIFQDLEQRQAPGAPKDRLLLIHTAEHIQKVFSLVPERGHTYLDPDTVLSPGSKEAALRAVGAVCAAVEAVLGESADNAFCAVRPPGHHAEPDSAMGFCLFNNVAIAARHALDNLGLNRVAIVDFDVHHGNGTQAAFEREARVLYASTHQFPLYPGTGQAEETGVGNIVNIPLRPGTDGAGFRRAVSQHILPALQSFNPQLILISAGFDAHRLDPLASLELEESDFAWITRKLLEYQVPIVSSLEGGYHLQALAASTAAHVEALMKDGHHPGR